MVPFRKFILVQFLSILTLSASAAEFNTGGSLEQLATVPVQKTEKSSLPADSSSPRKESLLPDWNKSKQQILGTGITAAGVGTIGLSLKPESTTSIMNRYADIYYSDDSSVPAEALSKVEENKRDLDRIYASGTRFRQNSLWTNHVEFLPSSSSFQDGSMIEVTSIDSSKKAYEASLARAKRNLEKAKRTFKKAMDRAESEDDEDIARHNYDKVKKNHDEIRNGQYAGPETEKRVVVSKTQYENYLKKQIESGREITRVVEIGSADIAQYRKANSIISKVFSQLKGSPAALKRALGVSGGAALVYLGVEILAQDTAESIDSNVENLTTRGTR